jgi:hypothetical protein
MNPRISKSWLDERRREDPDMFAREFLAEFVDGVSSYLTSEDVVAGVRGGERTLPPRPGLKYVGSLDPAYPHDNFALCVAHREGELTVVDGVWAWHRRGHEATLDAVADIAREYRIGCLRTDQHAATPIMEGLQRRPLGADYQPWTSETKADAVATLKIALNTRAVELPDDPALVEELVRLEARPTPGSYTRIGAASGSRDDRAVVVAAAVHSLVRPQTTPEAAQALLDLKRRWTSRAPMSCGRSQQSGL